MQLSYIYTHWLIESTPSHEKNNYQTQFSHQRHHRDCNSVNMSQLILCTASWKSNIGILLQDLHWKALFLLISFIGKRVNHSLCFFRCKHIVTWNFENLSVHSTYYLSFRVFSYKLQYERIGLSLKPRMTEWIMKKIVKHTRIALPHECCSSYWNSK